MLTYHLFEGDSAPLYQKLYLGVKEDIEKGTLVSGEKLPSKRSLAEHLGISVITVENAYEQLVAEGYLVAKPRKGYFVNALAPAWHKEGEQVRPIAQVPKEEWFLDFCTNSVTPENFPFSVWSRLTREVLSEQEQQLLQKQSHQGILKLRMVLAEFLRQYRGMEVDGEQIVIGAGTQYLYSMLMSIVGRNQLVAIENPSYGKIADSYGSNGISCCFIPMEEDGISLPLLYQSGAGVAHISPSHHFPTGRVTPIQKRWQLLQWAKERDGYLIEDDFDSEFRFQGKPLPTLQSIDKQGRVIYLNTFSKSISPAIGISYMILPYPLKQRCDSLLGFSSCGASALEQYTLAKFIEQGHFERHLNRMRRVYRVKRDSLIGLIKEHFQGVTYVILEEDAGLHFVLQLETKYSDETLRGRAKQQGLRLGFLSDYYREDEVCSPGRMLVNYTGMPLARMEEGIYRLAQILKEE